MPAKSELRLSNVLCDHISEQHGGNVSRISVRFKIKNSNPQGHLKIGYMGRCLDGENGTCPMQHSCGKVRITSNHSVFTSVKPDIPKVAPDAPRRIRRQCRRPKEWFVSLKETLRRQGVTEFDGKPVSKMSWDPKLKD